MLFFKNRQQRTNARTILMPQDILSTCQARTKVGDKPSTVEIYIIFEKDTVYFVSTKNLPGIKDLPDYVKDYPDKDWKKKKERLLYLLQFFRMMGKMP